MDSDIFAVLLGQSSRDAAADRLPTIDEEIIGSPQLEEFAVEWVHSGGVSADSEIVDMCNELDPSPAMLYSPLVTRGILKVEPMEALEEKVAALEGRVFDARDRLAKSESRVRQLTDELAATRKFADITVQTLEALKIEYHRALEAVATSRTAVRSEIYVNFEGDSSLNQRSDQSSVDQAKFDALARSLLASERRIAELTLEVDRLRNGRLPYTALIQMATNAVVPAEGKGTHALPATLQSEVVMADLLAEQPHASTYKSTDDLSSAEPNPDGQQACDLEASAIGDLSVSVLTARQNNHDPVILVRDTGVPGGAIRSVFERENCLRNTAASDRRVILHLGVGKTGTSALQTAFARNLNLLQLSGIRYPENKYVDKARRGTPTSGNALPLAAQLNPKLNIDQEEKENIDQMLRAFEDPSTNCVLFSSEKLADATPERLRLFREFCENLGIKVTGVMYTRSVVDHAYAQFVQFLRRGYSGTFREYLKEKWTYRFGPTADTWCEALGKGAMVFKDYDSCKRNLIDDFVRTVLGVDVDDASEIQPTATINRSLSRFEAKVFAEINKGLNVARDSNRLSNEILKRSPDISSRLQVWADEVEIVERLSEADRAHMKSNYNVDLAVLSRDVDVLTGSDLALDDSYVSLLNMVLAFTDFRVKG